MKTYEKSIRTYLKKLGFNNVNVKLVREFVTRIENGYTGSNDDLLSRDEVSTIKGIILFEYDK
jgi:hypothetical protein